MSGSSKATLNNSKIDNPRIRIKLFWKILVWFWVSLVIIITLSLFFGFFKSNQIRFDYIPPHMEHELSQTARKLKRQISRTNVEHQTARRRQQFFLLTLEGSSYSKQPIPQILSDLHSRVIRAGRPMTAIQKGDAFLGGLEIEINGESYWLYTQHSPPRFSRSLVTRFFHEFAISLLIIVFLISFPLSFLLSWIFTRPIKALKHATVSLRKNLEASEEISHLKMRRDEFGELAVEFDTMAQHVASLVNSQRQLLSDVSHELRSPLSRIKIALAVLEKQTDPRFDNYLQQLKNDSDKMNEMLDNLLALSRLEMMEAHSERHSFDLALLFRAVIEDGRFEAQAKNLVITEEIIENCTLIGDKEAILSGMENILRNAIKYTPLKGKIICRLNKTESGYQLLVEDNGPGVSSEKIDRIFDPYYRPDSDRSNQHGGVGLGLAIAKRAFELNGGKVSAENVRPHGLRILVNFQQLHS
ncbi:ATP-binding protein [Aliikangiella sp. G2MR2-5]|uniref:ATP-binding protein n=1 Tax=Aliikangiella sp. G2MR2-5 TaxID=2788943 RepID=UPI0018AB9BFE|nr:ATP-binding protein [Aliikangiella sp. G2MR2-5]